MKGFATGEAFRVLVRGGEMFELLRVFFEVGALVERGAEKRNVVALARESFADAMQHFGMPDSGIFEHRGVRIVAGYRSADTACVTHVRAYLDPPLDLGLAFTAHATAAHSASSDEPRRLETLLRPKLRASLDEASRRWSVSLSDTEVILAEGAIPSVSFYADAMPFAAKLVARLRTAAEKTSSASALTELASEYKALAGERGFERTKTPLGLTATDGAKIFVVRKKERSFGARAQKRMDLGGARAALVSAGEELDVTTDQGTSRRTIAESTRALLEALRAVGTVTIAESTLRVELSAAPSATDAARVLDATRAAADALQAEIVPTPWRSAYR